MKKFYKVLGTTLGLAIGFSGFTQENVGIGTTTPNESAVLDIQSSNQGLLIPRMSMENRNSISNPAAGLLIYQTNNSAGFYYFNGNKWNTMTQTEAKAVAAANVDNWSKTGDAGTSPGANFVGTTDDTPLMFKTNGVEAGKIGNSTTRNVSLGYASMRNITTGTDNVAIGHLAMLTASGGVSYNVAIGANALAFKANVGSQNMAIGRASLAYNEGNGNVAVGDASFQLNTTGYNNIGIGLNAGATNTVGYDNTYIGANAGFTSTGYGNTFIGASAGYNETGNNKLYIANTNTEMPLVYGDFSAKYVTIGDVTPALRMQGTATGGYNLLVKGGILTEKVKVALAAAGTDWADYVFEPSYKLMPLEAVESFTKENKHLPNVPSADEMVNSGLDVAQTSKMFMEKIEELTLYMIDLNKEVKALKAENEVLKASLKK